MATKTADPTAVITDVFVTSIKQGQELAAASVGAWVDFAGKAFTMPPMPSFDSLPTVDPQELIDMSFGFAEEVLATQKQLAQKVLEVVAPKPVKTA
jgi:hypothetical protein